MYKDMRSNKTSIVYRQIKPGEEAGVVDLVRKVFNIFVAPRYAKEGISEFKKFVHVGSLADRVNGGNLVLLAKFDHRIVGIIEIRNNCHIALLFVDESHQRTGIAKELIQRSIAICRKRKPDIQKITVNSSPNAFAVYEKIGFEGVEDEKVVNGIRFIPMELILNKKLSG